MRFFFVFVISLWASVSWAQVTLELSEEDIEIFELEQKVQRDRVDSADSATLRALDKLTGQVQDLTIRAGLPIEFGRLDIRMQDCRFPRNNPTGNAYAYLTITETAQDAPVFRGWMVAAAPALNALEHQRYDIWVMRCNR